MYADNQGIAGLDCWIVQSGLQSDLVDWIVNDNPKSILDFGFGLSILFFHFNPNPKKNQNYVIKMLKFHSPSCSINESKLIFIKIFKQLIISKDVS